MVQPPSTKAADSIPVQAVLADRSGVRLAQVDNRVSAEALEEDLGLISILRTSSEHSQEVDGETEGLDNHLFTRKP